LFASVPAAAQSSPAESAEGGAKAPARFALILGVNRSVDADAALLRYADDDAAKYQELFRGLGARTYLIARLDANTERLHAQAVAEAREPTRAELVRAVDQLVADMRFASERHVRTIVYVVFSGHGNAENGRAYLSLEDSRLFGSDLDNLILDRVGASEFDVIVDACQSYLLASTRGPGGRRHEVHDFVARPGIRPRRNLGMLLSTSISGESHEWQGVEAGIFSHEVRSGLYGAADADGDGVVTYAEIASFVQRANASITAERFRPEVYARPPQDGQALVDLRALPGHRIEIGRGEHAHYTLENSEGVQIAEFHNSSEQPVTILEPAQTLPLFLRRVNDDAEFAVPLGLEHVRVADLEPSSGLIASRGAAAYAFGKIFALPFGPSWVHRLPEEDTQDAPQPRRPGDRWRPVLGWSLVGVGLAAGLTGAGLELSAEQTRAGLASSASQQQAQDVNRTLQARGWQAGISFGISGLAAGAGAVILLSSPADARFGVSAAPSELQLWGRF
jgi:hypothetical protein